MKKEVLEITEQVFEETAFSGGKQIFPELTNEEVDYIIKTINSY